MLEKDLTIPSYSTSLLITYFEIDKVSLLNLKISNVLSNSSLFTDSVPMPTMAVREMVIESIDMSG